MGYNLEAGCWLTCPEGQKRNKSISRVDKSVCWKPEVLTKQEVSASERRWATECLQQRFILNRLTQRLEMLWDRLLKKPYQSVLTSSRGRLC